MGSSQKYGPTLVPQNMRCRSIIYKQKRPILLRTTLMDMKSLHGVVAHHVIHAGGLIPWPQSV